MKNQLIKISLPLILASLFVGVINDTNKGLTGIPVTNTNKFEKYVNTDAGKTAGSFTGTINKNGIYYDSKTNAYFLSTTAGLWTASDISKKGSWARITLGTGTTSNTWNVKNIIKVGLNYYVATATNGVWKSTKLSTGWALLNKPADVVVSEMSSYKLNNETFVILATDKGVYSSKEDGAFDVTQVFTGIPTINSVNFNANFVITWNKHIYISMTDTQTAANSGLWESLYSETTPDKLSFVKVNDGATTGNAFSGVVHENSLNLTKNKDFLAIGTGSGLYYATKTDFRNFVKVDTKAPEVINSLDIDENNNIISSNTKTGDTSLSKYNIASKKSYKYIPKTNGAIVANAKFNSLLINTSITLDMIVGQVSESTTNYIYTSTFVTSPLIPIKPNVKPKGGFTLSTGAIAGIAAGGALLIAIIGLSIALSVKKSKAKAKAKNANIKTKK